ncbi:hypothetical protein GCM10011591_12790 [Nocardia camponoti]|uniref:Uncharacterized protein n=1 Tax=Nocardia camponoti TaxID=1616106 RepID=A0A917QCD6_9NOCA|nr:hypothetical protein GCM10011591_12790 [Nocardia camponoti]
MTGTLVGFSAGYLIEHVPPTQSASYSAGSALFATGPMTVVGIGVLTAILAMCLLRWRCLRFRSASIAGLFGFAVLGGLSALPAPREWNELPIAAGVGVGLLIVPAVALPRSRVWFGLSIVIGLVLGRRFDELLGSDAGRLINYVDGPFIPDGVAFTSIALATALAIAVAGSAFSRADVEFDASPRLVAVSAAIPLAIGVALRLSDQLDWASTTSALGWITILLALVVAAFVAVLCRLLPTHSGISVASWSAAAAALSVVSAATIEPKNVLWGHEPSRAGFLGAAAVLALGGYCGRRWSRPLVAVGLCAAAVLSYGVAQLLSGGQVAACGAVLFAVGFAVAASFPTTPILLISLPTFVAFGLLASRVLATWFAPPVPRIADYYGPTAAHVTLGFAITDQGGSGDFGWTAYAVESGAAPHYSWVGLLAALLVIVTCAFLVAVRAGNSPRTTN